MSGIKRRADSSLKIKWLGCNPQTLRIKGGAEVTPNWEMAKK